MVTVHFAPPCSVRHTSGSDLVVWRRAARGLVLAVLLKLRSGEKGRCRAYRERNSTVGAESHLGLLSSGEERGSNIAGNCRMNRKFGQRPGSTATAKRAPKEAISKPEAAGRSAPL